MIYALRAHLKINFYSNFYGLKYRSVLTLKNKTDTESHRLVYNEIKFDNYYANKTGR